MLNGKKSIKIFDKKPVKSTQKLSLPDLQTEGEFSKKIQKRNKSRVSMKVPDGVKQKSSRSMVSMFSYISKSVMTNPEDNKAFIESLRSAEDYDDSEEKKLLHPRTKDTMYNVLDVPEREEIFEKLAIHESEQVMSSDYIERTPVQDYINGYMCSIAKKCTSEKVCVKSESSEKMEGIHFRNFHGKLAKNLINTINTVIISFEGLYI